MRYRPMGELGRGTYGTVYKVFDEVRNRLVAMKVFHLSMESAPEVVRALQKEARVTGKLHHPNIVALHGIGRHGGFYYLAMEYVDGKTVKDLLREHGHLPVADALWIAGEICRGLTHAHEQGMVHRDIKPGNIIVGGYVPGAGARANPEMQVKILDFGLAKILTPTNAKSTAFIGTAFYMAPEQIRGEAVDGRTDLYSLGITLFEMLTGTAPFKSGNVFADHQETPAPLPSEFVPVLPKVVDPVVARCLAKKPADRHPTAEALRIDLDALRTEQGPFDR